jgi:hypothetical protein
VGKRPNLKMGLAFFISKKIKRKEKKSGTEGINGKAEFL